MVKEKMATEAPQAQKEGEKRFFFFFLLCVCGASVANI
jgi:hypothetical protein